MSERFKLMPGCILVHELLPSIKSAGGIILSNDAKKMVGRCRQGRVLAKADTISNINKDDIILFGKFNGERISVDEHFVVLKINEVLAKVTNCENL